LAVCSPLLATVALSFGPAEYFAVVILGFATLPAFAEEGRIKLLVSLGLGLFMGTVGLDATTAVSRFTFGTTELLSGVPFVAAIIGLFGVSDMFYLWGQQSEKLQRPQAPRFRELFPSMQDWFQIRWAMLRGSIVGFLAGFMPGAGATIAAFTAYAVEQQVARDKTGFGQGRMEGLAAAEAGNNSAAIGAMVPLLTLGIPGSTATAIMFGGFLIWGLQPGPALFQNNPDFVWGLIASMLLGNVALLIMCMTMVPIFAQFLRIPFTVMAPLVVVMCAFGTYSVDSSISDVWIMFAFGVLGYIMRLALIPIAPMVLGLVLEPILESKLRLALTLSGGDIATFIERPIAASLLAVALLIFLGPRSWRSLGASPAGRPAKSRELPSARCVGQHEP
jgi:putative tricarboxylic transport membrane protein